MADKVCKMAKVPKESSLVQVETLHITDKELKVKYVKELYADKISNDEILNSDVWALVGKDNKKCYCITTLQKQGEDYNLPITSMKITHMNISLEPENESLELDFYIAIETYYVNNNINSISFTMTKKRGITTKAIKFFKKVGFIKFEEFSYKNHEGAVFLLKCEIEKWYEKEDGIYKPKRAGG